MANTGQLTRKTQEVAVLSRISELVLSLDLDDVLSKTLALLTETVGAERGSFFLLGPGRAAQRFITRRNLPPEISLFVVDTVLQQGLAGWVYRHKRGTIVYDTLTDERWVQFPDDPTPVRSVLCVPFVYEGRIHGIMTLEHAEPDHFNEDDLRLARAVANQATIAIRNAQLFDQVTTHERQLQTVLESIEEPVLTITPQGHVKLINPAALSMFGRPEEAVIDRPLAEVAADPFFRQVAEHIAAGHEHFELRDDHLNRDYLVRVSSWREGEASELGRVIVFNDITTLKDLTRLKSQMIQIASHDLKNPLGVIQGYTDMLLADLSSDTMIYSYISDIARVTRRMLDLVTELLNLERIETGATAGQKRFDPAQAIRQVLAEEQPKAQRKQQTLQHEIEPELPPLLGDPTQVRECFRNLIDNAIKYTPERGSITVRAFADHSEGRFHFQVEDTGYGIPQELQGKIFQRFYRAKQPGAEDIPGTGLGLSLVKAIIERHGGEVWFRSAAGQGSTFGLWLPLPAAQTDDAPATSAGDVGPFTTPLE